MIGTDTTGHSLDFLFGFPSHMVLRREDITCPHCDRVNHNIPLFKRCTFIALSCIWCDKLIKYYYE